MTLSSLNMFCSWWKSGDDGLFLGAVILGICSPLGGLVFAAVGGFFCDSLGLFTSFRQVMKMVPPHSALAKTDSLDPLAGRLNRDSTDTFDPDRPLAESRDTPLDIQNRPRF